MWLIRRYPPGFLSLSASVACERVSFFLLLSLLLLYLNEQLGFTIASATERIGLFVAASYLAPLLGGIAADGRLGAVRTASLGYLLAAIGYALLMSKRIPVLYAALTLIALGSGVAKSAVQALMAHLFTEKPEQRDSGFTVLYLLVNVAGFVGPVLGETVRSWVGWQASFAVAAVGMLAAWATLRAHRGSHRPTSQVRTAAVAESRAMSVPPRLLLSLCLLSLLFTVAHMQSNSTLLIWARDHTDRRLFGWEMPVPYVGSLHAALVLAVSPLLSLVMLRIPTAPDGTAVTTKVGVGMAATGLAYLPMAIAAHSTRGPSLVSLGWLLACLLLLSIGELLVSALGPSLVIRLAPPNKGGQWVGAWFVSSAIGFLVAGRIGALWDRVPHSLFFLGLTVLPFVSIVSSIGCRRLPPPR